MAKPTKPTKPPAKPAPTKPAPAKPAPSKPAPTKPAPSKPTPSKPAPSKPTPSKPASSKPTPSKPGKPPGSMAKDPKEKPKGLKRVSPGVYRDTKGNLVTSQGKPIPGARPPRKDKPSKPSKPSKPPKPTPGAPTTETPAGPTAPPEPTMEDLGDQPVRVGGEAYERVTEDFRNFDPYEMEQKYEMGFTQEMDRARQSVLSQFERRNAEQFGRERQSTQQAIVERGLDPNSPAAQAMMRDLNDREDRARQEAANAAEQAAYGVNKQASDQAYRAAMSPAEYFQTIQPSYIAGLQGQYGAEGQVFAATEADKQRKFEAQQEKLRRQQQERLARSGGGGGSQDTNAYPNYAINQYGQPQQPQQSATESATTGFVNAVPLAIANRR